MKNIKIQIYTKNIFFKLSRGNKFYIFDTYIIVQCDKFIFRSYQWPNNIIRFVYAVNDANYLYLYSKTKHCVQYFVKNF